MPSRSSQLQSNVEWQRWGKKDPLWAVATEIGRRRGEASGWTPEEFFAAGASDWQEFLRHWDNYGRNPRLCLEVGCGAGRITRHLATTFDYVLAVEVSPAMVAVGRSYF